MCQMFFLKPLLQCFFGWMTPMTRNQCPGTQQQGGLPQTSDAMKLQNRKSRDQNRCFHG